MAGILVSASTGAMDSLLGKLGTMLRDKYELLKGVRDDIKFLKDEIQAMHAFLLVMADVEEPDPRDKLLANAVRELSYEIEDKIDKFMVLVEDEPSSKFEGIMKILNKPMDIITSIKHRQKIAEDVKEIKSQVKEVSERSKRYTIGESSRTRHEKVDPRLCAVYKDASELVGIDGPTDELVKWLSYKEGEAAHHLKVASIVGYPGLGKTTLARQVYNKLGANFECRAFVSISRSPNMTKILSSILSQLRNKKKKKDDAYSGAQDPQLINEKNRDFLEEDDAHSGAQDPQLIIEEIRDFLEDKRYLIIIDDLWDEATWRILKCAFAKNNHGSSVMTTTRKNNVAKSCCSSQGNLVYEIKPLSDSDSKKLFFKRIFDSEEKCPPNLKEASEDILKKCGGLPLAINAISSLLVIRKTKEEWERVSCSIGFAQGRNSDIDAMNYILSLSYFDLPLYLRSCLLYLTMFPEDYEIERQRLIHRWISEGFIHGKDGEDLVEAGDMYFQELINRSLIQPLRINYDGKAWGCRVHDTVLDFLIDKSTEENFCTYLSNHSKSDSTIRRLSLMKNDDKGNIEQFDLSHARSLGVFCNADQLPSLGKSNALRVLDLENCSGLRDRHMRDIGRLFQLRYLNIKNSILVELPEWVTRLKRLERLFVPGFTKLPDCIENMEKLQDLGDINIFEQSVKFVEQLSKLINLRKLSVYLDYDSDKANYKKIEMLASSLRKLDTCKLHTLSIAFSLGGEDIGPLIARHPFFIPALKSIREITLCIGQLCWITKWMLSLANLEKLTVKKEIGQQEFDIVGSIPRLREFIGPSCIKRVVISSSSSGGFQRLQVFEFSLCVREFMFEAGAMPNVRKLALHIELEKIKSASGGRGGFDDIGIHHLSRLAELCVYIYCMGVRAADVEAVEVAVKSMAEAHPNRPKLEMKRYDEEMMLNDNDESDEDNDDSDESDEDNHESDEDNDESDDCPPPPPLNPPSAPAGAREKRLRSNVIVLWFSLCLPHLSWFSIAIPQKDNDESDD